MQLAWIIMQLLLVTIELVFSIYRLVQVYNKDRQAERTTTAADTVGCTG